MEGYGYRIILFIITFLYSFLICKNIAIINLHSVDCVRRHLLHVRKGCEHENFSNILLFCALVLGNWFYFVDICYLWRTFLLQCCRQIHIHIQVMMNSNYIIFSAGCFLFKDDDKSQDIFKRLYSEFPSRFVFGYFSRMSSTKLVTSAALHVIVLDFFSYYLGIWKLWYFLLFFSYDSCLISILLKAVIVEKWFDSDTVGIFTFPLTVCWPLF